MSTKKLCLLLSIAIVSGCGGAKDAADSGPASNNPSDLTLTPAQQSRVQIDTVALSHYTPSISTTGTVAFNGDQSTQVLSPVSGPVIRLLVEPGAYVTRGTILATVSSPDYAAALGTYRKAVATATNLQRIAQQNEQLFKTDALSRRDLEQSQTDAEGAVADQESALEQIKSLGIDSSAAFASGAGAAAAATGAIRAPISGTVVERLITPGQLLAAGTTPAFTIADLSTVWVMANVFESDLAAVHDGERVTVSGDVSPTPFEGTVDYIGALVDPATRATAVRVLVRNRNDLLKRDMYVNVSIAGNASRDGIIVPADAVLRDDQNLPYVYIASGAAPNTHYARRRVVLGSQIGTSYEIKSGLQVADHVVAHGALFLQFAESL